MISQQIRFNGIEASKPPFCTTHSVVSNKLRSVSYRKNESTVEFILDDILCTTKPCVTNSHCYLGACFCKPSFAGETCNKKLTVANPWYTKLCPNLEMIDTNNASLPLQFVGGEHDYRHTGSDPKFCAYLCYSNPQYGTAVVPKSLWLAAQKAEADLWKNVGLWARGSNSNDRAIEHWKAFDYFSFLNNSYDLGRVIEVGAGPWTQLKGFLHIRPNWKVSEFTVWEPGAQRYMKELQSCSYRTGVSLNRWSGSGQHNFPVYVNGDGGEELGSKGQIRHRGMNSSRVMEYDTLISINVIEHVQNAFDYLTGLYVSLKRGGLIIFHERYYDNRGIMNGDNYHPIRIKRIVLDRFLSGFKILYNNCSAYYEGRPDEKGYYVVATKL